MSNTAAPNNEHHEHMVRYVQKICCVNQGGFVMRFSVADAEGRNLTETTRNFPVLAYETIDLLEKGLETGSTIQPLIQVIAGRDNKGAAVRFAPNGQTATYKITGTTLINTVELIG